MHISKSKKCFNVKSSTYQDKDISRFKKKADHNLCGNFWKNYFRHLKLHPNPPN